MSKLSKRITTPIRKGLQKIGLWPVRSSFLKVFPKNGVCAELGVFQGAFSREIIQVTDPQKIHLIDPWWTVVGETYGEWSRQHNQGQLLSTHEAYKQAQESVAAVDKMGAAEFHIEDDLSCLKKFPDHYFDWVYIDSTHLYEHTRAELELLQQKVKPRGLIGGHDWHPDPTHPHHGVYLAVHEFCEKYGWRLKKVDKLFTQWCIERIPV